MTSKELIKTALEYKSVPRIPVTVLDGYTWMLRRLDMSYEELFNMPPKSAAKMAFDNYSELGSDMLYTTAGATSAISEVLGGKSDFSRKGMPVQPVRRALSSLSEVETLNADDLFKKVCEHEKFIAMGKQLEALAEINGDDKVIMAFSAGPLTSCAGYAGVEELLMALADGGSAAENALEFALKMTMHFIRYQVERGATAISLADPIASVNVISNEMFDRYFLPCFKRLMEDLKSFGLPVMLHICGDTTSRLVPLIGTGLDIFSVDEVDLADALKIARGHYTIFGNLNTMSVLQRMTSDEVYGLALERCKIAGNTGGFILAPGCDLPADTPEDNVRSMFKAAYDLKF